MSDFRCENCHDTGIIKCNNPDHGFIAVMPGDTGRLGCPLCDGYGNMYNSEQCFECSFCIEKLQAENKKLRELITEVESHGCLSGDCPHIIQEECEHEIFKFITEVINAKKEV